MTEAEHRIRAFSLGMKKLGNDSRNYLHKLAHVLFLVEQPPVYPVLEKKTPDLRNKNSTTCP